MSIRITFVAVCAVTVGVGYIIGMALAKGTSQLEWIWQVGYGLGTGLLMCLIAASVGFHYAQTFRRRLYDIEEAAALIAGGRLHHRINHFEDRDEIDRLGAQFNQMGEKLEQQVTLLQRMAEENQRLALDAQRAATMEERQRLARELHDSVSQQLFALTMMAETAIRLYEMKSGKLPLTLAQIADLATRAQREMRALLLHLRPVELDGRSFQEAAVAFLNAVQERHGLACAFACLTSDSFPAVVEEHLFRILQESIANVLKHANAATVRVRLNRQVDTYELTIVDDGVGISEESTVTTDMYGISAMHERAQWLGGRLELLPLNPGTAVRVVIPRTGEGAKLDDLRFSG